MAKRQASAETVPVAPEYNDEDGGAPEGGDDTAGQPDFETQLTSNDMYEADHAARLVSAAVLGLPTGNDEYDKAVLSAASGKMAEAVDTRLQISGLYDPQLETADSRLAAIFVHAAERAVRLTRYRVFQLEFLSHCLTTAAAVYAVRGDTVDKLYPDVLYDTAGACYQLLRRIHLVAPKAAAKAAAASATSSGGVRARPGKGVAAAASASGDGAAAGGDDDASGAAPALTADNIASSPQIEGLRKLCIAFLHAAAHALPGVEASIHADKDASAELKAELLAMHFPAKVAALLATERAREVVATVAACYSPKAHGPGTSSMYAFFVAPVLLVVLICGVGLLWGKQLVPELIRAAPYLRIPNHLWWAQWAGTAALGVAALALLWQMVSYSGARSIPRAQAALHGFLSSDGDIRLLHAGRAGGVSVGFDVFGPEEEDAGAETPADAVAVSPAEAAASAPDSGKSGKGKGPKAAAAPAAAAPAAPAAPAASSGGGAESGAAAASGGDGGVAYWGEAMGLDLETTRGLMEALDTANEVDEQLAAAEDEVAAAAAKASAEAAGEGASVAAPSPSEAAAPNNAAGTTLTVTLPDNLLPQLETLYYKLEELGEVGIAETVLERLNLVQRLLKENEAQQAAAGEEGEGAEEGANVPVAASAGIAAAAAGASELP